MNTEHGSRKRSAGARGLRALFLVLAYLTGLLVALTGAGALLLDGDAGNAWLGIALGAVMVAGAELVRRSTK